MLRLIVVAILVILFLVLSLPVLAYKRWLGKRDPKRQDKMAQVIIRWIFGVLLKVAGVQLQLEGTEHIPADRSVLFVGNHRSYFDIVTSYTAMKQPTGYVAKAEMEKIPLLSAWMREISCLFLNRTDIKEGLKTILAAIAQVKAGKSVFIFPEGTRNKNAAPEELLEFHEGSMKIAEKAGCPVIPVAIYGSDHIFEQQFPLIRSAKVVIRFGAPVDIKALPAEYKRRAGAYLQAEIKNMLSAIRAEHPEISYPLPKNQAEEAEDGRA